MKALVVITDSEVMKEFERAFLSGSSRGFTIVPKVWGRGKAGLKTGDRVHPGGLGLLFTVVPDQDLEDATAFLKGVRDQAGAQDVTKIFSTSVDEVV